MKKENFLIYLFITLPVLVVFFEIFQGKVNINGNILVSFYPVFAQNLPFKTTGLDQIRQFFPFFTLTFSQLKSGSIPLWNPYAFSGYPHMANFQSAVFYPITLIGTFLPQIVFWNVIRIIPYVLGSLFTYIYLKNFKLSKYASFFGAITFGLSPFMLTWGEDIVMSPHTVIWLPLALYFVDKYRETKFTKYIFWLSVSLALSVFAGFIQTTIYLYLLVVAYIVFRQKNELLKLSTYKLLCAFVFSIAISAIQLLPSFEAYLNSSRLNFVFEKRFDFLLSYKSLITYLSPDFFGSPATHNIFKPGIAQYYESILFIGIASLIFAIFACVKNKNNTIKFFIWSIAISLLVVINTPISKIILNIPIPYLASAIPNRILFIPSFSIAILAGFGMEKFIQKNSRRELFKIIHLILVAYILIIFSIVLTIVFRFKYFNSGVESSIPNALISLRNLVIPIIVFILTSTSVILAGKNKKNKTYASIFIIFISFVHIFIFAQKYLSFSSKKTVFPQTEVLDFIKNNQGFDRTIGFGRGRLENDMATQYQIYYPEGYDPSNVKLYLDFVNKMQHGKDQPLLNRYDADLGSWEKPTESLTNQGRRKLLNILGVKYIIVSKDESDNLDKFNLKKIFDDSNPKGFSVFENEESIPRVFLASSFINAESESEVINKLTSDFFDLKNSVVLENQNLNLVSGGNGSAEILSYKPQMVAIKTISPESKILVLSDVYYPGWKVKVDGVEKEVLKADSTFRAVKLSPGIHEVLFYYDSKIFKIGCVTSLGAIIVLITGLILTSKNKVKKKERRKILKPKR